MTVTIENMRPNPGDGVATFDAIFTGGWVIRRCVVIRRPDGALAAVTPLVRNGIRAVTIPDHHWFPFINAALDAYASMVADRPATDVPPTWATAGTWADAKTWANSDGLDAERESLALARI